MANTGVQEDVARQREEVLAIGQQFLSQLVPGSQEFNELQAAIQRFAVNVASPENEQGLVRDLGAQLVASQQARAAAGEALTPQQAQTNQAFGQFREASAFSPEEQAVLAALRGETGQDGVGVESIFGDIISTGQDPNAAFTSTFQPALDLAFDQINRQAAQRGLVTSGIPIEPSQRAAAELAIREAQARQQFRSQALQDVQGLFDVGQGLRSREIGVEGAGVDLAQGREASILDLLRQQTQGAAGRQDVLGQRSTARAGALGDVARAEESARSQQLSELLGTLAFTGAGAAFGGGAGANFGQRFGNALLGNTGGGGVEQLLAQQKSQPPRAGTPSPSRRLTRFAGSEEEDTLAQILGRQTPSFR